MLDAEFSVSPPTSAPCLLHECWTSNRFASAGDHDGSIDDVAAVDPVPRSPDL